MTVTCPQCQTATPADATCRAIAVRRPNTHVVAAVLRPAVPLDAHQAAVRHHRTAAWLGVVGVGCWWLGFAVLFAQFVQVVIRPDRSFAGRAVGTWLVPN